MNIKNRKHYEAALLEIQELDRNLESKANAALQAQADALAEAIEQYEIYRQGKIPPSPLEAIRAAIAHGGYSKQDFIQLVGDKTVASKILNGKRKLTDWMVLSLHRHWRIPLEIVTGAARADYIVNRFQVDFAGALEHIYDSEHEIAAAFAA